MTTATMDLFVPPLLVLMVILLTSSCCCISLIDAACVAQDRNGNFVQLWQLSLQTQQIYGVKYDAELDELVCERPNACGEWTIGHCNFVKCTHSQACRHTTFQNNSYVACYRYAACHQANFQYSHTVMCGMESSNSCVQATINVDEELSCWGPWACVSTPNMERQISVHVGARGVVRCLQGGTRGYSCQHLIVWVDHARRACLDHIYEVLDAEDEEDHSDKELSQKDNSHCAVICEGAGECDEENIHFRVLSG
ncbi:hypothetical protein ACA910_011196 [Epithemia clementina (nom. ined.)]